MLQRVHPVVVLTDPQHDTDATTPNVVGAKLYLNWPPLTPVALLWRPLVWRRMNRFAFSSSFHESRKLLGSFPMLVPKYRSIVAWMLERPAGLALWQVGFLSGQRPVVAMKSATE